MDSSGPRTEGCSKGGRGSGRETGSDLTQDLRSFINDSRLADVVFVVEGQDMPCIQALMCRCPFFYDLLLGEDIARERGARIVLPHITVEGFLTLREFLYTGKLQRLLEVPCSLQQDKDCFVDAVVGSLSAADMLYLPELAKVVTSTAISRYLSGHVNPFQLYEKLSCGSGKESFKPLLSRVRGHMVSVVDWMLRMDRDGPGARPLCSCLSVSSLVDIILLMREGLASEEALFRGIECWVKYSEPSEIRDGAEHLAVDGSPGPLPASSSAPAVPSTKGRLEGLFGVEQCSKMPIEFLKDVVAPSGLVPHSVVTATLFQQLELARELGICFDTRTNLVAERQLRQSYVTWTILNASFGPLKSFSASNSTSEAFCMAGRMWHLKIAFFACAQRHDTPAAKQNEPRMCVYICPSVTKRPSTRGQDASLPLRFVILNSNSTKAEVQPPEDGVQLPPLLDGSYGIKTACTVGTILDPLNGFVSQAGELRIQVRMPAPYVQPQDFDWAPENGLTITTCLPAMHG